MPRTVIHWFRRDLRLTDNTALHHATQAAEQVVPVYILSDWKQRHGWTGPNRQQFLCGNLESLAKNLEALGSRLIIRCGRADAELERLIRETQAQAVYFNRDYDPYGRAMEKRVQELCTRLGIECHSYQDSVLHEPDAVLTGAGLPYRVYTPYSKNWLSLPKTAPHGRPRTLGPAAPATVTSLPLPTLEHWQLPPCTAQIPAPGERAARERLKHFISSGILHRYGQERNLPAGQTTSMLSPDLRYGLLSIREIYQRCQEALVDESGKPQPAAAQASIQTYIKELAWREFYMAILWHFPQVFEQEFSPDWVGLPWPGTDADFQRWATGSTGFPIVDAGMRQLLKTGLMHNRLRMITAMFLTKDLHCDWRLGEAFFMQHLVDGENASNNGGWQWSAGTGADAAPYFRIQNPWLQSARFDPEGVYIKQWVPELKDVPAPLLHEPPSRPGLPLAKGYPIPMVDHHTERDRCLAIFAKHKEERV
ncbi:cryptochrome/photolyase family protein [Prosthecobacter vanneervenii]|uniref:Deoxyribodipyrimidine photo-lyase n=1 Tax=Prosthecobacter vanneervenii TaxID=48466 RepID=A0A7W7Y7Q1_9BACT|nr:deoxyribodipyrimidine photo-lyase [Prosthecobacter vanneervenii]MBB5031163.1 deoxyribodipyrimidine photo-lyase [Prosthecobacter vanneervenii]